MPLAFARFLFNPVDMFIHRKNSQPQQSRFHYLYSEILDMKKSTIANDYIHLQVFKLKSKIILFLNAHIHIYYILLLLTIVFFLLL